MTVPIEEFGKDHWSVFAYIETCVINATGAVGTPDRRKVYADFDRHPALQVPDLLTGKPRLAKFPIRLRHGVEKHDYDEWDCLDDCERAGLLENVGTGILPRFRLTDRGRRMAGQLRSWKAAGGTFATFVPTPIQEETP